MIISMVKFTDSDGSVFDVGGDDSIVVGTKDLYSAGFKDITYKTGLNGERTPSSQYFDEHAFTLTFTVTKREPTGKTFRMLMAYFQHTGMFTAEFGSVYGLPVFQFSVVDVKGDPWGDGDVVEVTCVADRGAFLGEKVTDYPFSGTTGGFILPVNAERFQLGHVVSTGFVEVTNNDVNPLGWRALFNYETSGTKIKWNVKATFPNGLVYQLGGMSTVRAGSVLRVQTVPTFQILLDGKSAVADLDYSTASLFNLPKGTSNIVLTTDINAEMTFQTVGTRNILGDI